MGRMKNGRVDRASLTAKRLSGHSRQIGLGFPRIGHARRMNRSDKRIKILISVAVDGFSFAVPAAHTFSLRLLHAAAACKSRIEYSKIKYSPEGKSIGHPSGYTTTEK